MYNLSIRSCTSPSLLAPRFVIFIWKFSISPGIESRTHWTRGRHSTAWASGADRLNCRYCIYYIDFSQHTPEVDIAESYVGYSRASKRLICYSVSADRFHFQLVVYADTYSMALSSVSQCHQPENMHVRESNPAHGLVSHVGMQMVTHHRDLHQGQWLCAQFSEFGT